MFWSALAAGTASSPPPAFRIAPAVDLVRSVSLSREIVRRQRLSGPGLSPRPGRHPARSRDRDRQAIRSGEGLRRPAQALGGRTHHRLAQPLPPTGQGPNLNPTRSPSSSSRPFDSCSENAVILHKVSGRTLSSTGRIQPVVATRFSFNWPASTGPNPELRRGVLHPSCGAKSALIERRSATSCGIYAAGGVTL